uniref:Uncharacterized protein n=1 Tax=Lepeophtheirus salmonis TaxID=72036 RepID=A0A0K2VH33_LEPSM
MRTPMPNFMLSLPLFSHGFRFPQMFLMSNLITT